MTQLELALCTHYRLLCHRQHFECESCGQTWAFTDPDNPIVTPNAEPHTRAHQSWTGDDMHVYPTNLPTAWLYPDDLSAIR